ncbi:MAG TPA: ABC transporter permease [Thermoanaerobaculaceae bacterium]|nr:ABC transporter permease [Thermoanaerobaculaceae bacterium]
MADLALKTMLHDKLRFAITVAGVAFAVTLVLVQVGLFLGLLSNASATIKQIDADLWVTSHATPNVDFPSAFSESLIERVRSVPGVERADNLIVAYLPMALPSGAKETVILYALEDFRRWGFPRRVTEGDPRDLRRGSFMFLDESAVRRFGPFAVGEYREVNDRRLRIIGRTRGVVSFTTTPIGLVDYFTAQALNRDQLAGRTHYIVVKLTPGTDRAVVRAELARRLPNNDVLSRDDWASQSRAYWVRTTGLGLNMFITVFLGCLVGVVVVAQTLYTSTMEHLKEFGTVKAIGGSNGQIYALLAKQSVIAALVGFAVGAAQSYAMRPLVARIHLHLLIPTAFVAAVAVGTVAMCLAAGMISYRKVASIDPALVFRT